MSTDRRRALVVENPLLIVLVVALMFLVAIVVVIGAVYYIESGPERPVAGGRAACEPWPRDYGASIWDDPEVAAGPAAGHAP